MGSNIVIELLLNILVPIVKSLMIYYVGKNVANKENKIKNLKRYNEELKVLNKLVKDKSDEIERINNLSNDDVYNEWLS